MDYVSNRAVSGSAILLAETQRCVKPAKHQKKYSQCKVSTASRSTRREGPQSRGRAHHTDTHGLELVLSMASISYNGTQTVVEIPEHENSQVSDRGQLSHSGRQLGQVPLDSQHEDSSITTTSRGRWARFKHWCATIGRRVKAEFWAELPFVKPRLLVIVLCLIFQVSSIVHQCWTNAWCVHKYFLSTAAR